MIRPILVSWLLLSAAGTAAVPDPAAHEQGRQIYNFRCYYCHGYSGNARTLASRFLTPPPRDFTRWQGATREAMIEAVTHGRPGTAMAGFANILSAGEIAQVVDFVRHEFILAKKENTRYHTAENGWPNHRRYRIAYPFALGEIPLDTDPARLSDEQRRGRQLFLDTCITCHDRAHVNDEGPVWESHPVSYPRVNSVLDYRRVDAVSAASVYARHDIAPVLENPDARLKRGERLFQENCAFCHAADGTGKNWIGRFLEPHPRNLTDPAFMKDMTRQRLRRVIEDGLPGTSMPAWKSVLEKADIEALIHYIDSVFHPLRGTANGKAKID